MPETVGFPFQPSEWSCCALNICAPWKSRLGIYPEEKISLTFQTKNPGAMLRLRPVNMDFRYRQSYSGPALDAYEKVLIDTIRGDQMLFLRQDAVELSWSFLSPILAKCESCGSRQQMLFPYRAGSWGPQAAFELQR